MYSRTRTAVCAGMEGKDVVVETDISRGLPGIGMSGLASTMVMESRERIKSAIMNSGYEFPKGRITVNLTPASLRKNSSCLDLPIAAGILASEGYIRTRMLDKWGMIGELALDGRVLGVEAALPMMLHMADKDLEGIIVPEANRAEAALAGGNIYAVASLRECAMLLSMDPSEAAAKAAAGEIVSKVSAGDVTILTGSHGASGDADAYMFCVCDQPGIKVSTIEKLVRAYEESDAGIVSLSWNEKMCNPKIFSSKYRDELMTLSGDVGGRQIIKDHEDDLLLVEADSESEVRDIDTPL